MSDTLVRDAAARRRAGMPDAGACAVARAAFDAAHPEDTVILFGSRARGDFRPNSDIDLLVVAGGHVNQDDYAIISAAANRKAREIYRGSTPIDIAHLSREAFDDGRRARNHVAGQAVRDGFDVNGEKVTYDNPEPTNWPDIRQRIANAERELRTLVILVENDADDEPIGFHAQQALENALKGWVSALDDDYGNTHDLADLAAIVRRHPSEDDTPAGERLIWLTSYAVGYRYAGALLGLDDPGELRETVTDAVETMIARIRTLAGRE